MLKPIARKAKRAVIKTLDTSKELGYQGLDLLEANIPAMAEHKKTSDVVWLDLGDLGDLVKPDGPHEQWQDHGLGLLRTILHQNGVHTDLLSTRTVTNWNQLRQQLQGYQTLIMNIRSYTFPGARKAAQVFKEVNPNGLVLTGGMHATVAVDEMEGIGNFDRICQGPGENAIVDLVKDPMAFERVFVGIGAKSMAEWPTIDRTLWPQPNRRLRQNFNWPMEPECGWGPAACGHYFDQSSLSLAMCFLQ